MHVNMIISESAIKIIKRNVNIAVYIVIEITSYKPWWFHVCIFGLLFGNTAAVKIVTRHVCSVTSFSPRRVDVVICGPRLFLDLCDNE